MDQANITRERRTNKRREGVYVEYAIVPDYDSRSRVAYKPCFLRNFSTTGASLQIQEDLTSPVLIGVKLYDPQSNRPIETIGRIIWQEEDAGRNPHIRPKINVGVKFLQMEEDSQHRLSMMDMYFESQLNKPYNPLDDL